MAQATIELAPEVRRFLEGSPLGGIVGGQELPASNGGTFVTYDPGSGEKLAEVANFQPEDVDRAVRAAQRAFEESTWATMSAHERGALLHRWVEEVERQKDVIARIESLDCGKILRQAESDVQNFIDTMRYFIEMSLHLSPRSVLAVPRYEAYLYRAAWGPCGFIFPWNFPLLLLGWGIAPALAAGNTVVVKPAEDTPLSTLYVVRLAKEAGIPDGVMNVVPGLGKVTGAALSQHPGLRRMSFTGSPEVGRLVAEACGRNLIPVKLELGGKGAAIVFDDVDPEATADRLAEAVTFHCGQVCCTATRWIIHRKIYDRFIERARAKLGSLRIGYELDSHVDLGPVINRKQKDRILSYIERGVGQGAKLLLEGGEAEVPGRRGFYVKPALLAGSLDNVAAQEEIFGPVAYVTSFEDESEAIAKANYTQYGLANSVWSRDLDRARRVAEGLEAANSWINAHNLFPHGVPYGGIKKSGLGGGVLSEQTFLDYLRSTSVVRPL